MFLFSFRVWYNIQILYFDLYFGWSVQEQLERVPKPYMYNIMET